MLLRPGSRELPRSKAAGIVARGGGARTANCRAGGELSVGVGTSEARRGLAAMGLRARSAPRASVQAQATQAKHRSSSSGLGQYFKRHHADQLPRSVAHNEARALHDHNDNVIVITSHRRTRYVLREGGETPWQVLALVTNSSFTCSDLPARQGRRARLRPLPPQWTTVSL